MYLIKSISYSKHTEEGFSVEGRLHFRHLMDCHLHLEVKVQVLFGHRHGPTLRHVALPCGGRGIRQSTHQINVRAWQKNLDRELSNKYQCEGCGMDNRPTVGLGSLRALQ